MKPARGWPCIRRYLLVDDNGAVLHRLATALRAALRPRAVTCEERDRAGTAIEALAAGRFDAVFVSLALAGGESGLDLLRAVSARWPHVPCILHTSRPAGDPVVGEAMSLGAFAYLAKPLRAEDLGRVLRELDRGWAGAGSIR